MPSIGEAPWRKWVVVASQMIAAIRIDPDREFVDALRDLTASVTLWESMGHVDRG